MKCKELLDYVKAFLKQESPTYIHSLLQSTLRQVHSLFQSEFSTLCYLVLPLSISSTL